MSDEERIKELEEEIYNMRSDLAARAECVMALEMENQRLRDALEKIQCSHEEGCNYDRSPDLEEIWHEHPDPYQHDERCSYRVAHEALKPRGQE